MQTITILGATGSIGCNTLDVILRHPDRFSVFAISGHQQIEKLMQQAKACSCRYVVLPDDSHYQQARELADSLGVHAEILCGEDYLERIASAPEVDAVMAAIVGAAGLKPTLAAVHAGKRVLLANKESLVMSGALFIDAANQSNAEVIPIDSEHNAIYQCLPENFVYGDLKGSGIARILLTGSGGPFRERDPETFSSVTPEQACAHPNWSMGQKISVDSATMMNKGLEFIEACHLFGLRAEDISVVLHPQSTIHSMVQYVDGSVLAQMGNPDMRTPIAHGLAYPDRIDAGVDMLDFTDMAAFTFSTPCPERYPNLFLAIEAEKAGQCRTTQLNAANEVAVDAFLNKQIRFDQIERINKETLNRLEPTDVSSLQKVLEVDAAARRLSQQIVSEIHLGV